MRRILSVLFFLPFACLANRKTDSLLHVAAAMSRVDSGRIPIYNQVAWQYLAEGDTAATRRYLHKSRELSEEVHYDKGMLEAYNNIGLYYTRFGGINEAVEWFAKGLAVAGKMNSADAKAKSCINIAGAYMSAARYAEAIQYYLDALKYLEQINDPQRLAINYHCLGTAYYLLKDYPLSLKYYRESLQTGMKMGRPDSSGYNYNGLGVVYKELLQYDSARYYLDKAYADAVRNGDIYLLSHNLSDRGEVYNKLGFTDKARESLLQALALHRQLSDQRGISETQILLGDAYISYRQYSVARLYYDSALVQATAIGLKDVQMNAWKGLSTMYKRMGDHAASLAAFERYANLKDSLYTETSTRQIAEMQTRYNTEKKEKENLLLQKQNAEERLQIAHERTQKYILAAALGFLAVIVAVYYNWYRLRQKNQVLKEKELRAYAVFQAQEDEKVKLSKDLHDGVGATLALIKLNISSIQADATTENMIARTKALASDAIREVRGISHNLMPSALVKSGLQAALADLAEQVQLSGALNVQFNYKLIDRLQPEMERNLFRIVQEATNNIIKHAAAKNMTVQLEQKGAHVILSISDDGVGFDKASLNSISGNGLNNIYSRTDLMKGKADINTSRGAGTRITIIIPFKQTA